jgi:hypothetical protein
VPLGDVALRQDPAPQTTFIGSQDTIGCVDDVDPELGEHLGEAIAASGGPELVGRTRRTKR